MTEEIGGLRANEVYGDFTAVEDLSFTLDAARSSASAARNGAGKTDEAARARRASCCKRGGIGLAGHDLATPTGGRSSQLSAFGQDETALSST